MKKSYTQPKLHLDLLKQYVLSDLQLNGSDIDPMEPVLGKDNDLEV